jgi:hypothetical protein
MEEQMNVINIRDLGAKGDFDPVTGAGSDDTLAIQKALNDAAAASSATGATPTVLFPPGCYKVDKYDSSGDFTSVALRNARNVTLLGAGGTLYQGSESVRLLGVFESTGTHIRGLQLIGNGARCNRQDAEHKTGITVNYRSRRTLITDCYISNFLGDCIYIADKLDDKKPGQRVRNVIVSRCTLKERFGDGIWSSNTSPGTRSRAAIAVIDATDVKIVDNMIYGRIDLEPNSDGQRVANILVSNNQFLSGPVYPSAESIPDRPLSPWRDEPFDIQGSRSGPPAVLEQGVAVNSGAESPSPSQVRNVVVMCNTFEYGRISMPVRGIAMDVVGNVFERGLIELAGASNVNGDPSPGYTRAACVRNNIAKGPLRITKGLPTEERCFIRVYGEMDFTEITGNTSDVGNGYCIGYDKTVYHDDENGKKSYKGGRNYYANNVNRGGNAKGVFGVIAEDGDHALELPPCDTDVSVGNWHNTDSSVEKATFGPARVTKWESF